MESDEFLVWLTVERYKYKQEKMSDDGACKRIAKDGGVAYFSLDKAKDVVAPSIHNNPRGLARILSEAKKARAENPQLAAAWDRALNDVLGREHRPVGNYDLYKPRHPRVG